VLKAVVLAGGNGIRLWPKSRSDLPKQFMPFLGGKSMFQRTLDRLTAFLPTKDIYVVTLDQYATFVKDQSNLPPEQLILEPEARNTAACIGLAATHFLRHNQDPVLITMPADHYIEGEDEFREAVNKACFQARKEACVVTLGIKPTRPETAYGYIKIRENTLEDIFQVEEFTEKPDVITAQNWVSKPQYYWNSGIMAWRASYIESLIAAHLPQLAQGLKAIKTVSRTEQSTIHWEKVKQQIYKELPSISIDYGILEKLPVTYLIPVKFQWDDLGSWSALDRWIPRDEQSNVIVGDHKLLQTKECTIYSERTFVGTIGVEQLIIVVTDDAVLVCHKDKEQEIKSMLEHFKQHE
jgi:mannose-1-phosphate guanylyltransferase